MDFVSLEKREHVAIMKIDRKETMNALNLKMMHEINEILDEVNADEDIYVLIITGTGKAFVSGADIKEMVEFSPMEAMEWETYGSELSVRIENLLLQL